MTSGCRGLGKFAQRPIPRLNCAGDEHIFQFVRVFPLSTDCSSNVIASRSIRHIADFAQRLVTAARRAGADQADALAVRSVSLSVDVRDGAVEELQRSEGDDLGLRVLVGRRQAVVSTNDLKSNGFEALAERAVAMARAAPEDPFAGLADPALLARTTPDLDLIDPDMPGVDVLETRAREAESAGLAVPGVTKSGGAGASAGMAGVGAGDQSRLSARPTVSKRRRHNIAFVVRVRDGKAEWVNVQLAKR